MRIDSVRGYGIRSNVSKVNVRKFDNPPVVANPQQEKAPNFKGCNIFKVVGFIAGTAAAVVLAPGLAAIGLAGIGAAPGLLAGAAIDEKIDEKNNKSD